MFEARCKRRIEGEKGIAAVSHWRTCETADRAAVALVQLVRWRSFLIENRVGAHAHHWQ